jgi:hypothetical protein
VASCVQDTNSVNLTVAGGLLAADLIVDPALDDTLSVGAAGAKAAGGDGWVPLPATLTYLGTSGVNYTVTPSVDLRTVLTIGSRIKLTHAAATKFFVVVAITNSVVTLMPLAGATLAATAITNPYMSQAATPNGYAFAGPLVLNDGGAEIVALHYDAAAGHWYSPPRPVCAISANQTTTSAAYGNVGGVATVILPFRSMSALGLSWQFRWRANITWAASQSASGVQLTAETADTNTAGGLAQDTTNVFAESLAFTALNTRVLDSGWVDINPSVAVKDNLVIVPRFKSDGTRTLTLTAIAFSVDARLVY